MRTISGGGALERVLLDGEDERLEGDAGRPSSEIFCRGRRPSLATGEKKDGREIEATCQPLVPALQAELEN